METSHLMDLFIEFEWKHFHHEASLIKYKFHERVQHERRAMSSCIIASFVHVFGNHKVILE